VGRALPRRGAAMAARDDDERAVRLRRVVEEEAERDGIPRPLADDRVPEGMILVPQELPAGARPLRVELVRERRDVVDAELRARELEERGMLPERAQALVHLRHRLDDLDDVEVRALPDEVADAELGDLGEGDRAAEDLLLRFRRRDLDDPRAGLLDRA